MTYCWVNNYQLEAYAYEDVIGKAEAEVVNIQKPTRVAAIWYYGLLPE